MPLSLLAAIAFALVMIASPWVAVVALALNAAAAILAQALPLTSPLFADPLSRAPPMIEGPDPFVSVHMLIAPAERETAPRALEAAKSLVYAPFELLALDRAGLGAWEGARVLALPADLGDAEALNLGLEATDWQARYVAVIHADFEVAPRFLRLAIDHLRREDVSFVQFPRALRAHSARAAAIDLERSDFLLHAAAATRPMLQIGSTPVIAVAALRESGGWRPQAFAAEADLGARLMQAGLKGLFVAAPTGRLLTSPPFAELRAERAEWLRGAAQTLAADWRSFARRRSLAGVAHLTTGAAFWLLPAVALAAAAGLEPDRGGVDLAVGVATATILATAAASGLRLLWRGVAARAPALGIVCALLLRLALVWTASTAWMNQSAHHARGRGRFLMRIEEAGVMPLAAGALGIAAGVSRGEIWAGVASALVLGSWLAMRWAQRAIG